MLFAKDINIITAANKNEPNGIRSYEAALKYWKKKEDIYFAAQHNSAFKNFLDSLTAIPIAE